MKVVASFNAKDFGEYDFAQRLELFEKLGKSVRRNNDTRRETDELVTAIVHAAKSHEGPSNARGQPYCTST